MPEVLDIASLPSLSDVGFTAGRDGLREFCRRIFSAPGPRFLKNENNQLVVFRNADLRAFGAAPEIGNVPIGTLFPSRYTKTDDPQEKLPGLHLQSAAAWSGQTHTYKLAQSESCQPDGGAGTKDCAPDH
jgi:hypothetical protein